jgi:hypothetical protein
MERAMGIEPKSEVWVVFDEAAGAGVCCCPRRGEEKQRSENAAKHGQLA